MPDQSTTIPAGTRVTVENVASLPIGTVAIWRHACQEWIATRTAADVWRCITPECKRVHGVHCGVTYTDSEMTEAPAAHIVSAEIERLDRSKP